VSEKPPVREPERESLIEKIEQSEIDRKVEGESQGKVERPTLDEIDLERPKTRELTSITEAHAREEYFIYLHGRSRFQAQIEEAVQRRETRGQTLEARVLQVLFELLRREQSRPLPEQRKNDKRRKSSKLGI
jgi:hypothetical protein